MKTAISVPDAIFARVDERAAELGISRSEFYARAAARYLGEIDGSRLRRQIDAAIAFESAESRRETREFIESGARSLAARSEDEEW